MPIFGLDSSGRIAIDSIIHAMDAAGLSGLALLCKEARDDRITLVRLRRDDVFPKDLLKAASLPQIILLGDDDYQSSGPSGWKATQDLFEWTRCAVLHAAAADLDTYASGILLAHMVGRLAFVETDTAHVEQWATACEHVGLQYIAISPGVGHHPVEPSSAELQ